MSIRQDTTTRYCSTADVARYVRGLHALSTGGDFPTESSAEEAEPSASDVESFIQKWTAKFDRKTGQSFRANQVFDETHDHDRLYYWLSGHPIRLIKRNIITPLDSSKGDKLEVWTGNKWEDWVADPDREEGRDQDYWVDGPAGILFIYERAILRPHPKFRVSYRYGNTGEHNADEDVVDEDGDNVADYVPADVRDAVAAAAAADIIESDFFGANVPGNNNASNSDPGQASERWYEQFEDTYNDYKKVHWI